MNLRGALLLAALLTACDRNESSSQSGQSNESSERARADVALPSGTTLSLRSAVTITSRRNKVGEPVSATLRGAALNQDGDTVLPAGAVFLGSITAIAPAENAGGRGTLRLAFSRVRFGGHSYPVEVTVNSLGTTMVGRGVTAGDAGKVGAGAAVGAVAGRIIGGNATGTAVGAAAGAAAGTAVAVQTRDTDITLQAGAPVRVTLAHRFEREVTATD
jgi:hypothetical protein